MLPRLAAPSQFSAFCGSLASGIAASGTQIGGFGSRAPVSGLLEHVLARCLARAHTGKRLVNPASGIVVEFAPQPWFRSTVDLNTLAREATGEWIAARGSESAAAASWSAWQSLEALSFAICLRYRDRFKVPDGLHIEICDVPDVAGVLAHSSALAALWPHKRRLRVAEYVEYTRGSAGELARALVVCGLASGTMIRRLPLAGFDPVDAADRREPRPRALPTAIRALARLLGLAPRVEVAEPKAQKMTELPPAGHVENKLVICGDFGSGKTTALRTLLDAAALTMDVAVDSEEEKRIKSNTTVGFDFGVIRSEDQPVFIYAAPGQERFRIVAESLLRGTHGVLLLVDGSQGEPLASVKRWLEIVHRSQPDAPVVVALNRVTAETPALESFRKLLRTGRGPRGAVVVADPMNRAEMLACLRLLVLLIGSRDDG
ncbi:MAG: GTP-binding protein [Casimicrobiaceae bacterium]